MSQLVRVIARSGFRDEAIPNIERDSNKDGPVGKETYFVYILTNKHNTVLYTGVTNNLEKRASQHKIKLYAGFTSRYNVGKLVYYEPFGDIEAAIAREKQIKAGSRQKKLDLVNSMNPDWKDLVEEWA